MIDRTKLRELHGVDLPLHVLEQDYLQALYLQELYRETEAIVFKGGTFLKHAHGLDRFSEDLDFTAVTNGVETDTVDRNVTDRKTDTTDTAKTDITRSLETAATALERYGLSASLEDVDERTDVVLGTLRFQGPLYDGSERSRGAIEIDVSTRDDVLLDPEWNRLFFPYPETRAVTARCLAIEEAFAEKLRALATRTRGRDLYDTWFLLQQGVTVDSSLFERKMAGVGESPSVTIRHTVAEWERDLSILLDRPPEYDDVLATVIDSLRSADIPVADQR